MSDTKTTRVRLILEDGTVYTGVAFGDLTPRTTAGEVCFNTSLIGYQEVLTDPSYAGQIVTMTYPQMGNYGINEDDLESSRIHVRGFVVRELSRVTSNYRSHLSLSDWLAREGVQGIAEIDTRALTRKLRVEGAMKGVISTDQDVSHSDLVEQAKASQGLVGRDLVQTVSRQAEETWSADLGDWQPLQGDIALPDQRFKVAALDCGIKHNILRNLVAAGCEVTVLPYDTPAERIRELKPDGLFISNGPGDPAAVTAAVDTLKQVAHEQPTFGICLGHQLLSLALGAETFKLKFGHRGGNQPVQNIHTRKVEITSQNHGFAVDPDSLKRVGGEPTHLNMNDNTLEGFRINDKPIFAVQYHPEASPGPHDARYLFDCFIAMMQTGVSPTGEQMDQAQQQRNNVATYVAS